MPVEAEEILKQQGVEDWFADVHGGEPWTLLYKVGVPLLETGVCLFSCLADPQVWVESSKGSPSWPVRIGTGLPGFSQFYGGSEPVTEYHRYGGDDPIEPIVIVRDYPNERSNTVEVVEELRHLFNLYENTLGTHFLIEDDGSETPVIKVSDTKVSIHTPLLMRYLAAKQLCLVLMIDSDVWIKRSETTGSITLPPERNTSTDNVYVDFYSRLVDEDFLFSRFFGKKIVLPPDISECGIWPFEEPKGYEEFIIGEDEKGREVLCNCNPDILDNYFGANPGAQHYFTPVFFKREVLRKYYEDSNRYQVEDAHVSYRSLWSIRVDNESPEYVIVFLGDLGRDLPTTEQIYWRGYNIKPHGRKLSETTVRRSFLGEFADPKSPEYRFKSTYLRCRKAWQENFGWDLFLEPHDADKYILERLRIPLTENTGEFDDQVIDLAKLLVDSLNEDAIVNNISGVVEEGARGIRKLEIMLSELDYSAAERDIDFLRTLQGLRSKGAAHRKGSDYDISEAGLDPENLQHSFEELLERSIAMLESLSSFTP